MDNISKKERDGGGKSTGGGLTFFGLLLLLVLWVTLLDYILIGVGIIVLVIALVNKLFWKH